MSKLSVPIKARSRYSVKACLIFFYCYKNYNIKSTLSLCKVYFIQNLMSEKIRFKECVDHVQEIVR